MRYVISPGRARDVLFRPRRRRPHFEACPRASLPDKRLAGDRAGPQTTRWRPLHWHRTPSRVCGADILALRRRLPLISSCPFPGLHTSKMTSEARGRLFVMYDLWPMRQLVSRRPPLPFDRPHDPTHPFSSCAACNTQKRVAGTAPVPPARLARRRPSSVLFV